jgi:hypothetical protein
VTISFSRSMSLAVIKNFGTSLTTHPVETTKMLRQPAGRLSVRCHCPKARSRAMIRSHNPCPVFARRHAWLIFACLLLWERLATRFFRLLFLDAGILRHWWLVNYPPLKGRASCINLQRLKFQRKGSSLSHTLNSRRSAVLCALFVACCRSCGGVYVPVVIFHQPGNHRRSATSGSG